MNIIIIGGGAAGLMAAKQLSLSHQITVLEAKEELGGRIRTAGNLEAGAEFIHGRLPVTLALLREAELTYTPAGGKMFRVEKNKWQQDEEMIAGWDELLEHMQQLPEDMTLQEYLDANIPEAGSASLRNNIIRYAQGFDLADVSRVSVKFLSREWASEEGHNYRVDQGYQSLVNFLAEECRKHQCVIHTKSKVKTVSWKKGNVVVTTTDGQIHHAEKLIVAISLGLLQQSSIHFTPHIDQYLHAANAIGWGNVIKIILTFSNPFWEDHQQDTGFIFSSETIPTWWTQAPDRSPVLTGWLGGPPSARYQKKDLPELALNCLAEIFQQEISVLKEMLIASYCQDWSEDADVGGAYSYDTPFSAQARAVLNEALEETIYFAGEALYSGNHPGTVEAALISGRDVAGKIDPPSGTL